MTIGQMMAQSGLLTLLGMGVVFTFIIIMILCMGLMHKIIHACGLDKEEKKDAPSASQAPAQDKSAVVAAIATAVHEKEA